MQPTHFNRRQFLATSGIALSVANIGWGESNRPSRILLRSSWQTVNIGDIAHTPGVLRILETHLPQAEITLWPSYVDNGVRELLTSRFPRLKIATRGSEELERAFKECDFFLHGSGPSLVAERDVNQWRKETGKPYGIYGITVSPKTSASTIAIAEEVAMTTSRKGRNEQRKSDNQTTPVEDRGGWRVGRRGRHAAAEPRRCGDSQSNRRSSFREAEES